MDIEGKWAEEGKNNYFYFSLKSKEEFLIKYNKVFPVGTYIAMKIDTWQTCYINVFQEFVWINWHCWGTSQEKKMVKRLNFPHQIF